MNLSLIGRTAQIYWYEIPDHFKNVTIDEFVIMPNHVHGILVLSNPVVGTSPVMPQRVMPLGGD